MTLRSLELFAGIGGLSLGLERAGLCRPAAFCEINPFARSVLKKQWPGVAQFEDVRTLNADALDARGIGGINLIAAGFPCQPFSAAGNQLGEADDRHLWPHVERLAGELQPRWIVAENVPRLLTIDRGRTFGRILAGLGALGYDAEWECVPASAFGYPHRRDRLFLVAYAQGLRRHQGIWAAQGADRYDSVLGRGPGGFGDQKYPEDQSGVARMADGLPDQLDRNHALGNAVVPAVAQWIGECILAAEGAA